MAIAPSGFFGGIYLAALFVIAVARGRGPYPVLELVGSQGSGKTIYAQLLKSILDPGPVMVRSLPRTEQDLAIAAQDSHVLVFDNLTGPLSRPHSDMLCRAATGGTFTTATVTPRRQVRLNVCRPVILTAIESVVTAPDLRDRTLTISLPVMESSHRRTEEEIWSTFADVHPLLLGKVLDGIHSGLIGEQVFARTSSSRMMDVWQWMRACSSASGCHPIWSPRSRKAAERSRLRRLPNQRHLSCRCGCWRGPDLKGPLKNLLFACASTAFTTPSRPTGGRLE